MSMWTRIVAIGAIVLSLSLLSPTIAGAEPTELPANSVKVTPVPNSPLDPFWVKLERLREDRQLQDLVEDDINRSLAIRAQIQAEVDRAFGHTTTLLNVLLGVLTALPILAAVSIWFIRRSVINQIIGETKRQIQEEVDRQLEAEVATELKQQAAAFQQRVEQLEAEFQAQLSQLKSLFSDAQREKDQIIQELAQITPSPIRDSATPEAKEKIHALTRQLEQLKSTNSQLSFTANDYVEQGKALYFENRYEDAIACYDKAIQMEPENAKAWLSRGAILAKLQNYEAAIAAYDRTIQLKPDSSEAWFGRGTVLAKLQRWDEAIVAYDQAIQLKPDASLAWFGKARCQALQGQGDLSLTTLQQAIHLNGDRCKEMAKTDPAFDLLREQATFQELIS
ncbi:tetratricopeptide repeat protein [Pantanalinema rosaneae CENA516]|uniref:tetratricopeptide repeat protein n=1 Tax=Pantanalinema rosaneae TaxID=1620701 RepID=UPI003D700C58